MKKNQLPTVTLVIYAYNAQHTVTEFLESLQTQKLDNCILEKILLISDGSTDETVWNAQKLKLENLEVWNFKNHIGIVSRLQQIYSALKSTVIVQTNAEVAFAHPKVLSQLVRPLLTNPRVGITCGSAEPQNPQTWVERLVSTAANLHQKLGSSVGNGNTLLTVDGRLLAIRHELFHALRIPKVIVAYDAYMYVHALTHGFFYKYVASAKIVYRSPQSAQEYIARSLRVLTKPTLSAKVSSKVVLNSVHAIPTKLRLNLLVKKFLRNPLAIGFILCINAYTQFKALLTNRKLQHKKFPSKISRRLEFKL